MLPAVRNNGSALTPVAAPTNRLSNVFDHFDRLFENALAPFAPLVSAPNWTGWAATPVSVWEDADAVHVEIDAPGAAEKDIELTIHDGELIFRYERKAATTRDGAEARTLGRYERRVALPDGVDVEKVEAKLANGVLAVTCPKSPAAKPRKIAVALEAPKGE
jgi:HSP20 family protein